MTNKTDKKTTADKPKVPVKLRKRMLGVEKQKPEVETSLEKMEKEAAQAFGKAKPEQPTGLQKDTLLAKDPADLLQTVGKQVPLK